MGAPDGNKLVRATIIATSDVPGEVDDATQWLENWRGKLSQISEDEGCGCCVHIGNVEGPEEVIRTIPSHLKGYSDWSTKPDAAGR